MKAARLSSQSRLPLQLHGSHQTLAKPDCCEQYVALLVPGGLCRLDVEPASLRSTGKPGPVVRLQSQLAQPVHTLL